MLSILLLGAGLAMAGREPAGEPLCEPLGTDDFDQAIQASFASIYRDDPARHRAIVDDLEARIPCLAFVPDPERWADLLVGIAIAAHYQGEDWQAPLATALRVHADVRRHVGAGHPIATWSPPPEPPPTGIVVPEGIRLYVDGERVREVPAREGLHLVQVRTGDGLDSLLLDDTPIPAAWLETPPLVDRVAVILSFDVLGGGARRVQAVQSPGDWAKEDSEATTTAAATLAFGIRPYRRFAIRAQGTVAAPADLPQLDASLTVGAGDRGWMVGVGVGARSLRSAYGPFSRWSVLVHPRADVVLRHPISESWSLEGGASLGFWSYVLPGSVWGVAEWGEATRFRFGLQGRGALGWYTQKNVERDITVFEWLIGATIGVVWGRG